MSGEAKPSEAKSLLDGWFDLETFFFFLPFFYFLIQTILREGVRLSLVMGHRPNIGIK